MLFRKKNKINVFSDGSLNYSNKFFSLKSQIIFFDNHFQNIKIFKKNLGKIKTSLIFKKLKLSKMFLYFRKIEKTRL